MRNLKKLLSALCFCFWFCASSYSQSLTISLLDEQILRLTLLEQNLQTLNQDLQQAEQKLEKAEQQLLSAEVQLDELTMDLNDSQQNFKTLSKTLEQSEQKLKIWKTLSISFMTSTAIVSTILIIQVVSK